MATVSNGRGLLSPGGASINNLASGDAPRSCLTMATLETPGVGLGQSQAFAWFFVTPYNYLHTIVRFVGETSPLLGAPAVYRQLRAWMEERLHIAFAPDPDPATGSGTIRGAAQEEGNLDVGALPEHRDGQRGLPVG